ncbi:MAG TPA: hypothetical protein VMA09_11565 [Candidatus Binataceae bacterium]|nr:hypothetical protein [Candidatus Binataceae bacterium]
MLRTANTLLCGALALGLAAMAGCAPQQTPHDATGSQPGSVANNGWQNSGGGSGTLTYGQPSPAGTVAGGTVDRPRSEALSEYLKSHHLPLVSAQVVSSSSGTPQVILFGYVATEYGKSDAEQKARTYLQNPSVLVDNRIQISPELAGASSNGGNSNGSGNSSYDPYAAGSVQDYQNQFDPQAAQQQYQYQQQGSGVMSPGMSLLLGLLGGGIGVGGGSGGFGGGFGGGGVGFGGGGGGFGVGGGSTYGGYGYPTYPPAPTGGGFP